MNNNKRSVFSPTVVCHSDGKSEWQELGNSSICKALAEPSLMSSPNPQKPCKNPVLIMSTGNPCTARGRREVETGEVQEVCKFAKQS